MEFFDEQTMTYLLVVVLLAPAGWISIKLLDHFRNV